MSLADRLRAIDRSIADPEATSIASVEGEPADPPASTATEPEPTRSGRVHHPSDEAWAIAKRTVRSLVLEEMAPRIDGLHGAGLEAEVRATLDDILRREDVSISPIERHTFVAEMISDTLGYGPLDRYLSDPEVAEVMCNSFDDIWVERNGRLEQVDATFGDDAHYRKVIERIVGRVGRRVDESSPMVDARLPDGSRVNAIIPPLALRGAALTIRRFAADAITADDLVSLGTYSPELVAVLSACVEGRLNIVVSGGTGTGKTTNLNIMSSFIPDGERIVTIEDAAELQLQQRHVVSLEARPPNTEGSGEVRIRDLVRNSLRMRPDRIIVGECRGAEALDMLQAMNTGHEGSMTTIHANSARDALTRLETMVLMSGFDLPMRAIREQVAAAIDIIVQVGRRPDGRRVVSALAEVQGIEGDMIQIQEVLRLAELPDGSTAIIPTGLRPHFLDILRERGVEVPTAAFRRERPGAP